MLPGRKQGDNGSPGGPAGTVSSLPPPPSQGLEGLQASHGFDLGWVPLCFVPIPTPNPQRWCQAGEAPAPPGRSSHLEIPKAWKCSRAEVSEGPVFWPGEEGSGPPSRFQLSQFQPYFLSFLLSLPPRPSSLKLGERPWAIFCPQTTAPPPPRAGRGYLQLCPHRPEPPSAGRLPAGLLLQQLCMGGAGRFGLY